MRTNNGVEGLNGKLKTLFLSARGRQACSLSTTMKVLVEEFLPELWRDYCRDNYKFSGNYRRYDSKVFRMVVKCSFFIEKFCLFKLDFLILYCGVMVRYG